MRRGLYRHGKGGRRQELPVLHHPFSYIANPRDLANVAGLGGIYGVPDLLWCAGDGDSPTRGPALSVTGTPEARTSPYQLDDGSDVASEYYDGTEDREVANAETGDVDIVLFCVFRLLNCPLYGRVFSTRAGGTAADPGVEISISSNNRIVFSVTGNGVYYSQISTTGDSPVTSWIACVGIYQSSTGNVSLVLPGQTFGPTASGASAVAGEYYSIAARNNFARMSGDMLLVSYWRQAGIAASYTADSFGLSKELLQRFSGILSQRGDNGILARNSAAVWEDHNGIWAIASNGLPRAGGGIGCRAMGAARTNEGYRNINPADITALTTTGAKAPTVVDDSTALEADGCEVWGPNAYEYANDTGSTQHVRMSAQTGDVSDRSLQALIRIVSGAGTVNLGLYDESAGTFAGSAIYDGYDARTIIDGQTPGDTDCTLALEVPDGVTVRWIAHGMETGEVCTSPIPNWATATAATRAAEVLTTSHTPSDTEGSIACELTPLGWGGADIGLTNEILSRTGGTALLLYTHNGGTTRIYDGTTPVGTVSQVEDVESSIRTRWGGGGLSIDVDGVVDSGAYDGSLVASGALTVSPSRGEVAIKNLKAYDSGS